MMCGIQHKTGLERRKICKFLSLDWLTPQAILLDKEISDKNSLVACTIFCGQGKSEAAMWWFRL